MSAAPGEALLSVRDLCVYFRAEHGLVKAVDGVSFDVARGEVLGLVGESGSGKTVTSLALMGLVPRPPAFYPRGEVHFAGQELLHAPDSALRKLRGRRIAMIFQDPMTALNPYLSIERQLSEVLELHEGLSHAAACTRSIEMLAKVGIPDPARRMKAYPHELSGGMRQRVMIAMALLCEPELLIADEPTTAVDVTVQAQVLELMRELQRGSSMSMILITHDLGVVAGMADRIAVMYAGRIVESAPVDELFARPRHPYTHGLLGSIPRMDTPRSAALTPIAGLPPDLSNLPAGCPFRPRCAKAFAACGEAYPALEPLPGAAPVHSVRCFAVERGTA
jgi:oligopeptide/dipeptide ABC transporter ATP-binding protein